MRLILKAGNKWNITTAVFLVALALMSAFGSSSVLQAQPRATIQETFVPNFRIEPLVHRLEGRRGDVLAFQYKIESSNRDVDIEVLPVGLRQTLTGQILHNSDGYTDPNFELLNDGRHKLIRDVPLAIEGIVKVPNGTANIYTFGILVREIPKDSTQENSVDASGRPITRAGLRFVTQYVLRLEVEVTGSQGNPHANIAFEQADVLSVRGLPKFSAIVRNSSDSTCEFQMRARFRAFPGDRSFQPVSLLMPIRESLQSTDRYVAKVLPQSAVRMQGFFGQPLMSGDYDVDLEMMVGDRVVAKETVKVSAESTKFPAQDIQIASIGEQLYVAPGQIEVSQLRGGQRRVTCEIWNNSKVTQVVGIETENARGTPVTTIVVQPNRLTLSPQSKRKVTVLLRSAPDPESPVVYGDLVFNSRSLDGSTNLEGRIPLAIHLATGTEPELRMEPVRWVSEGEAGSFKTVVSNVGKAHLALDAQLHIESLTGVRLQILSGFGRWLMPGKQCELDFKLESPLPVGEYQLVTELQNGMKPIVIRQDFAVSEFGPSEEAIDSNDSSDIVPSTSTMSTR